MNRLQHTNGPTEGFGSDIKQFVFYNITLGDCLEAYCDNLDERFLGSN